MAYKHGIDVSEAQGQIDWVKVKASGKVDFAIIRCSLGWTDGNIALRRDSRILENVKGCEANGIPYGIYWYSYCLKPENAKREAEYVLRVIDGTKPTMGVWLDIEANAQISLGKDAITKIAVDECAVLKAAGYDVGVYSYLYWLEHYMDMSQLAEYPVWLAQVDVEKPSYKGDIAMWQYSWTGNIDGINGDVDLDLSYTADPVIKSPILVEIDDIIDRLLKLRKEIEKNG